MGMFSRRLFLKQTAIQWTRSSIDEEGQPSFALSGTDLKVAWHDEAKEFRDEEGEIHMSKSVVHGDAEFNVGDYLKEGAQDTNTTADPLAEGAFQIKATFKTPSPDGRYYVYGAMLV